jgi:carbon-monoxide dehydrogenase medium subunit
MHSFEWVEPKTMAEALNYLSLDDTNIRMVSGGTALMLMMKSGVFAPTKLVNLRSVQGFSDISVKDNHLCIGSLTSLTEIEHSALVEKELSVLKEVMKKLSNVRVRNAARLGGALSHGDPHMDLPPLLSCLDASVRIQSKDSTRVMQVQDLYVGYYETALEKNELITEVLIPLKPKYHSVYMKCTTRSADDWPALGVAVNLQSNKNTIEDIRIVLGAVCEVPTTLSLTQAFLTNKSINDAVLDEAAAIALTEISPLSDELGSSEYKLHLVSIYVKRAIQALMNKGANNG